MVMEESLKIGSTAIRGVFVVHMNKNGANFKVKPEQKYVTCNFYFKF